MEHVPAFSVKSVDSTEPATLLLAASRPSWAKVYQSGKPLSVHLFAAFQLREWDAEIFYGRRRLTPEWIEKGNA